LSRETVLLALLALTALLLRALVGVWRPDLDVMGTLVIGLMTVIFLLPTFHAWACQTTLLDTQRKQLCHALAMGLSGLLFLGYVVN
jgi:multisubunit Na+/H+ antiporter MnhB subunit